MAVTDQYSFGLDDVKIAARASEGNWETNYDVESVQMLGMEIDLETGELEGDDIITDQHSRIQAINGTLRFGMKNLQLLSILTGMTYDEYTNYERIIVGRDNMDYFGICGRAYHTAGGGDRQLFVAKAKAMSNFEVGFEKGNYSIQNMQFRGLWENATYGAGLVITNNTAQTVTVPPTMAS